MNSIFVNIDYSWPEEHVKVTYMLGHTINEIKPVKIEPVYNEILSYFFLSDLSARWHHFMV